MMLPSLEAASLHIQSSIQRFSDAHNTTRERIEEVNALAPIEVEIPKTNLNNCQSSTLVRKDLRALQERQLQDLDKNAATLKAILQTITELKVTRWRQR